jgi:predicted PurR-regulated permease PerM
MPVCVSFRRAQQLRENSTFRKYDDKYKITPKLESEARKLPTRLASIAKRLSSVTVGVFTTLTKVISVLALGFFLLRDGPRLANRLCRIRGPDQEERMRRLGTTSTDRCPARSQGISRSA